jgi:hypothetical protein
MGLGVKSPNADVRQSTCLGLEIIHMDIDQHYLSWFRLCIVLYHILAVCALLAAPYFTPVYIKMDVALCHGKSGSTREGTTQPAIPSSHGLCLLGRQNILMSVAIAMGLTEQHHCCFSVPFYSAILTMVDLVNDTSIVMCASAKSTASAPPLEYDQIN